MDRWSTQQKKGKLTDAEIKGLVNKWHDQRREGDLNKAVVDREMKTMEAKLEKYNVDQLGEIPIEREDGTRGSWCAKWEDAQEKRSEG
jgi:hypothetical protein